MFLLTGCGTGAILAVGYLAALIRVRLGSRYGLVTLLVSLLLVNAIAGIGLTLFFYDLYYRRDTTVMVIWIYSSMLGVKNLMFALSHWILAWQYNKIADEVPRALE